jgi:hypothetical protein
VVAVATPFSGSVYARCVPPPAVRASAANIELGQPGHFCVLADPELGRAVHDAVHLLDVGP